MAIDFDKIRAKVQQLSGNAPKKNSVLWSPKPGDKGQPKSYEIRIVPWPDGNDGQPFKERSFYYNIGGQQGRPILAPSQFGQPDPIQELINKLRATGTPESLELCKQFYPKRRYYAPIIVRGEEDQGVKIWSFGKQIANKLLQFILGDFGDITDPKDGRDLTVTCMQQPGKQFADTDVQPRVKQTPLGPPKEAKQWLSTAPNLDELYTLASFDEISKRVKDHMAGGASEGDGIEKMAAKPSVKKSSATVSDDEMSAVSDVFARLDDIAEED